VFRTAFEIDQRWVVDLAADRAPSVCQGQSLNIYLSSDLHKWDLLMLHWTAWERGIKSLYYLRSKSVQRAGFAGVEADNTAQWPKRALAVDEIKYDECLACHESRR
jgi:ribonucleoside-diphosphate reductase alpha chain